MRKVLLIVAMATASIAGFAVPASAVIHVTVPADDCAPDNARAVSNPRFEEQIQLLAAEGKVTLPLGGFKNAPTTCPAG